MLKKRVIKLTGFKETQMGLYGLDVKGSVWVYQGAKYGWSKLNMTAMSQSELKNKQWNKEDPLTTDDIPF